MTQVLKVHFKYTKVTKTFNCYILLILILDAEQKKKEFIFKFVIKKQF